MSKDKPKTIYDILKTPSVTNALKAKSIAKQLIELYGEAEEYKIKKQKLIVELEIVEDYLNSHGVCNGNSTCLC